MATTVGQHSVAAFTSPVNGTTPIDANSVRGNDNTMRSAYVDHDADTGIHVQSSTLAARPAAGTAGRKWITEDSGIYTLWFDDGVHWHPVSSEAVAITVLATENLVKGDVVKVVGWNNGQDLAEVAKTTSASDVAFAVITATVSSGVLGYATNTGVLQDINTNAYAVGTVLYPNASGGFTSTKPTSGNYQPVAYVLRQNTNNGVIYVEFSAPRIVERSDNTASTIVLRDSNGDFSAGTITATAVNATTLDLTNLEVTNIKAKDGTQAIAIADSTGALTVSGDLTVDTSTLKVDSANNRVGIGTASPAYALDAAGQTRTFGTPSAFSGLQYLATYTGQSPVALGQGSDATGYLINIANAGLAFGTNNTEKMRLDASGNLAVDTNTLYVDATNNRVGVGTASPGVPLDVLGQTAIRVDGAGSTTPLILRNNNTSSTQLVKLGFDSSGAIKASINAAVFGNDYMTFNVGSDTERMRLDASGNLGLGVTPSAWDASYKAATVNGFSVASQDATGGSELSKNSYVSSGGTQRYVANGYATKYEQSAGVHKFFTAASGTAEAAITFTQAMTLDASGRLSVNTTSATGYLTVDTKAQFGLDIFRSDSSAQYSGIRFRDTTNANTYGQLGWDSTGLRLDGVAGTMYFSTSGTERARITSGGYFKASDDATYDDATGAYHELSAQSGTWVSVHRNKSGSGASGIYVKYSASAPNGTGNDFLYCSDNVTPRATIRSNGGLANYQANDVNLSDERVKADIKPVGSYWDKLKAIEIVTFKYKDQTHDDDNIGVIAQQVEAVAPEFIDVDGFGETPEDGVPLKTVYTTDMYHAAIKALQEAMTRIESLEARLAALES